MNPLELPIYDAVERLTELIGTEQVIVVAGETGSGKSTQLPQICLRAGRGANGLIGHTQPRRIAARSVAERIAEELGTKLGDRVGYAVRFLDQVSAATEIKLMTDGIMLAEIQRDPKLKAYDTIIIDEAHERSLNIDFLLGYLKQLLPERPDLLVIITSATIDTERFSEHFGNAPIVEVTGRTFPVELRYRPLEEDENQVDGVCRAVQELAHEGDGDVLVFFSGEREIRDAALALTALKMRNTDVLPLYGRLSSAEQHRVFESHPGRRIVLATNVAETSLTVPGIRYVVDPGTARISRFSNRTKVQRLPIEAVSQASANQRAGRCGRVADGICIRLYDEEDYENRDEFTEPEILRTGLSSVILQMAALGFGDIETFPFVDPPLDRQVRDGINLLEELDALNPDKAGTRKWLTPVGRKLSRLPLDPRLARMVIAGAEQGCLKELLIIASGLGIIDPRERPTGKEAQAKESHARFKDPDSDFLGFLNLWNYLQEERRSRSGNQFRKMCRNEYLNYLRVREWQDVHSQLKRVARQLGLQPNKDEADPAAIHRAVLTGLKSNIGMKSTKDESYRGARNANFVIAPGSSLYKKGPKWVVAAELVETNRLYARVCARILPEWIEQVASEQLVYAYSDPWWERTRAAAVAEERISIFGLPLVANRRINFHRISPKHARELFIYHALVLGEWDSPQHFLTHNAKILDEASQLEARVRAGDLVKGPDELETWYSRRIPETVVSGREFDKWWKRTRPKTPELLNFDLEDVLRRTLTADDTDDYPDHLLAGGLNLALTYELADDHTDGVIAEIPVGALRHLDATVFEWLVPGFREELVEHLIRSLPKDQRKFFVPVPQAVSDILPELDPSLGRIGDVLAAALVRRSGLPISADALNRVERPPHLQFFFEVVDEDSLVLATGNDLNAIGELVSQEVRATIAKIGHELETTGATTWTFETIPQQTETEALGHLVEVYPALDDEGTTVGIKLHESRGLQAEAMWKGTRRLLRLTVPSRLKDVVRTLSNQERLALATSPHGSEGLFLDDCIDAAFDRAMERAGAPAWGGAAFETLQTAVRSDIGSDLAAVVAAGVETLVKHGELQVALEQATGMATAAAATEIEQHLDGLIYPGFVASIGTNIDRLPRYIDAALIRLERAPDRVRQDALASETLQRLEADYYAKVDRAGLTKELDEIGWAIEELRVGLFAERLGTIGTVSEKRIRKMLSRV